MLKGALHNVLGVPKGKPLQVKYKQPLRPELPLAQHHQLDPSESTTAGDAEQSAIMALVAAREIGDPAAAAAALLHNFAQQQTSPPQHQHQEQRIHNGDTNEQLLMESTAAAALRTKRQQTKPDLSSAVMAKRMRPKIAGQSGEEEVDEDGNAKRSRPYTCVVAITAPADDSSPLTCGTDQLENLPMLKYTSPDSNKKDPVSDKQFRQCDVLLGRGGMTNHHIGNAHFRALVSKFRYNYHAAKKGAKGQLSKKLANFVRHKGGRFLQRDDDESAWFECGDQRAHGKCAQALREGSAEVMREGALAESDGKIIAPKLFQHLGNDGLEIQRAPTHYNNGMGGGYLLGDASYGANRYLPHAMTHQSMQAGTPAAMPMPTAMAMRTVSQQHSIPTQLHNMMGQSSNIVSNTPRNMVPHRAPFRNNGGTVAHPGMPARPSVALTQMTDDPRLDKSNRARARDWGNQSAGGRTASLGAEAAKAEKEEARASKRAKVEEEEVEEEDEEEEEVDYI